VPTFKAGSGAAPIKFSVSIVGSRELQLFLRKFSADIQGSVRRDSLLEIAGRVQTLATTKYIKRGRGTAPPLPKVLSARKGTLQSQIGIDIRRLPKSVSVGTPLVYGRVHEDGGPVLVPTHSRTSKLGNSFTVRGHVKTFPKRAYLVPALEDVTPKMAAITLKHIRRKTGISL